MISELRKALGPKWPNKDPVKINTSDIHDYVKCEVNMIQTTWYDNYLAENVSSGI